MWCCLVLVVGCVVGRCQKQAPAAGRRRLQHSVQAATCGQGRIFQLGLWHMLHVDKGLACACVRGAMHCVQPAGM